jgi:hypothetical protein
MSEQPLSALVGRVAAATPAAEPVRSCGVDPAIVPAMKPKHRRVLAASGTLLERASNLNPGTGLRDPVAPVNALYAISLLRLVWAPIASKIIVPMRNQRRLWLEGCGK